MKNFIAARKNMVDCQIQTAGVINRDLLNAFRNVPRETFLPADLQKVAYTDHALDLGSSRYLPEPISHSRMIQFAEPQKTDLVMDIGGGSGYPSAIMSSLVRGVVAVEDNAAWLDHLAHCCASLSISNVASVKAALSEGCAQFAPYDIIFIHGAVTEIPQNLLAQLAPGGRLLTIVKKPGTTMGQVTLVRNSVGNKFSSRVLFEAAAHYLPGFEPAQAFVFK